MDQEQARQKFRQQTGQLLSVWDQQDFLQPQFCLLYTSSYEADGDAKKALDAGVKAAEEGIEYTKTIIATKGRASYLGERSIGHQDPGATSFTLMLKAVQELA